jgi:hypothetical protein
MPTVLPEYQQVTRALDEVLHGLPPKLIAITGPVLSGKSSLGRFLAWNFNVSLIETDLLIISAEPWQHDLNQLKHMIDVRLGMCRPVLVEGITSLRLLQAIGKNPDFVVFLQGSRSSISGLFGEESVELDARSVSSPSIQIRLSHDDC